jgi:hypothetical protein
VLALEESSASWSSAGNDRGEIRPISAANPGWGAPRIHTELGRLGINVSETTVAKYNRWSLVPLTSELPTTATLVCKTHRSLALVSGAQSLLSRTQVCTEQPSNALSALS